MDERPGWDVASNLWAMCALGTQVALLRLG